MAGRGTSVLPDGHARWWRTDRQLWWRDFDALGHLTAGSYGVLYQDAFADFALEAWGSLDVWYVVTRMDIHYLSEIRPQDSPVRAHVRVDDVGRSSFNVTIVLRTAAGRAASVAKCFFAAWDGESRKSRPLTTSEIDGLTVLSGRSAESPGSENR